MESILRKKCPDSVQNLPPSSMFPRHPKGAIIMASLDHPMYVVNIGHLSFSIIKLCKVRTTYKKDRMADWSEAPDAVQSEERRGEFEIRRRKKFVGKSESRVGRENKFFLFSLCILM